MSYETILIEKDASTAIVTINRPNKLNALNKETMHLKICRKIKTSKPSF